MTYYVPVSQSQILNLISKSNLKFTTIEPVITDGCFEQTFEVDKAFHKLTILLKCSKNEQTITLKYLNYTKSFKDYETFNHFFEYFKENTNKFLLLMEWDEKFIRLDSNNFELKNALNQIVGFVKFTSANTFNLFIDNKTQTYELTQETISDILEMFVYIVDLRFVDVQEHHNKLIDSLNLLFGHFITYETVEEPSNFITSKFELPIQKVNVSPHLKSFQTLKNLSIISQDWKWFHLLSY